MKTTIDGAGRLVIPKQFRDAMSLTGGAEVEITLRHGVIEVTSVVADLSWNIRDGIPFPILAPGEGLTDEEIRDAIESVRR